MNVRDQRRAEIVAAARALVAEGGVGALTIGALEGRLAFTRGVITYHFRDKDEIVAAALDSAVEEIDAATFAGVRAGGSFAEKVRAVLATKVGGFLSHREAAVVLVSFWARVSADPRVAETNRRLFSGWRAQARSLVEAGQRHGDVPADVPADAAAALMVGMVVGIVTQALFEGVDAEPLVDEATQTLVARWTARA